MATREATTAGMRRRRTGAASSSRAALTRRTYYNVACCESLAGRTADALEHLRQAIDKRVGCSDFDPIRDQPSFEELIGR